ncbi:MAG: DUF5606 domain-containing protein [Bacteroidales bacterium]|nr:DUF5606 domain-containing protein [Bacteroidales bacterium]
MNLSNILVIAGKPDLSELVSQTKGGAVVKNLATGQKYAVFKNDRISSLGEIRLFCDNGEKPLDEVMAALRDVQEGQPTAFDPRKASADEMFALLEKALPDYDRERVHTSDVKKLMNWYNLLLSAGKLTETEETSTTTEE